MKQHKLYLFALMFLLLSVGIVVAQKSTNYEVHRFVTVSGGTANSANYTINAVIGQPAVTVADGANYKSSAGFLFPVQNDGRFDIYLPLVLK